MVDDGWTAVASLEELREGSPTRLDLDGIGVLLLRVGDDVHVVGNRCTHQGAPLDRGAVRIAGSEATITCPAHGSVFRFADGRVVRPPAREPLPTFDVRISAGTIELRARA
jgi:nitrite reductase/ring-hydroxylating ferredoxin subunit